MCQLRPQLFLIDAFLRGVIGTELLHAVDLLHRCRRNVDARELQELALDFAELDAEASELHLLVDTSQELDVAVPGPAHQIAGTIHAFSVDRDEFFRRHFRQIQIAPADSLTGDIELSRHTLRHEPAVRIHDVKLVVRKRPPDAFVIIIPLHFIEGGKERTFRWPVHVEEPIIRLADRRHFLSARGHQAQRTVLKGRAQLHTDLRREEGNRYMIVFDVLIQCLHVQAHCIRNDIGSGSAGECRIDIQHVRIEAEVCIGQAPVLCCHRKVPDIPMAEIHQAVMLEHTALRPAGGA